MKWTCGTPLFSKERPYRDRYKIKAKQHFLGCLSFQKGPSIKYVHSKGEGGGQGKSIHL